MSRRIPEWFGATDDTPVPPRVRLRVFERYCGRCHICTRKIGAGETWTLEHIIPLIAGGANAEDNLNITCSNCLPGKNAKDVADKSKVARIRKRHLGIAPKRARPFPGSKASGLRKRMNGQVERRT